jgi:hypothetical protein
MLASTSALTGLTGLEVIAIMPILCDLPCPSG